MNLPDITDKALLLMFVKFHRDDEFLEDTLFCKQFEERTTGEDVFRLTDGYMGMKGIERRNCIRIWTGQQLLLGKNCGVAKQILEKAQGS